MQKVETELEGGQIRPSFKDHKVKEIRKATMELHGRLLFVWAGKDLVGQCHVDHPGMVRHMDQLERIFGVHIENKRWMLQQLLDHQEEE